VQFEFPGALAVPDGSYLARGERAEESVLVIETLSAPPPPSRRRRLLDGDAVPDLRLPLTRATTVRAWEPFESPEEAGRWLEDAVTVRQSIDELTGEGIALLNRALHACAIADAEPHFQEETAERAVTVRLGYGSGEEVSAGRFSVARDIDLRQRTGSRRARRDEELRPQEGIAAVLAGRSQPDVCETLALRVRAELDSGRLREAALQLPAALRALLAELPGTLLDSDHEKDLAAITARQDEAEGAAGVALQEGLDTQAEQHVRELLELAERVLRRRRIRRG
jgi:hypothetical protein